jgi:hypothetical protein
VYEVLNSLVGRLGCVYSVRLGHESKEPNAHPEGFLGRALWHGMIAPITFLISLFAEGVSIYETNNNGRWYEFGFMLGIKSIRR